jgi:hypothetical protein
MSTDIEKIDIESGQDTSMKKVESEETNKKS